MLAWRCGVVSAVFDQVGRWSGIWFLGLALLPPLPCQAQAPAHSAAGGMVAPWTRVPAVVVVGANVNDARLPLVEDAVAFWNRSFAELGSAFRLGPLTQATAATPADELRALSDRVLSRTGPTQFPESLRGAPGDLIVALSDGDFISFGMRWPSLEKALVAIKSDRFWPLSLPNVARNVISYEIGHAIGLGHNSDATALICGRPAPCRPDAFASPTERYFPLTAAEKSAAAEPLPRRLGAR